MKPSKFLPLVALVAPILASPKVYAPYTKKSWSNDGYTPSTTQSSYKAGSTGSNDYNGGDSNKYGKSYQYSNKKYSNNQRLSNASPSYTSNPYSPSGSSTPSTGTFSQLSVTNTNTTGNSSVISSGSITLPAGCEQKNGIGIGWLPSDTPLSTIEAALGSPACTLGEYAHITQTGTYTDSSGQLLPHISDISTNGGAASTIFVASVMPDIPFTSVTSDVAQGVANVLSQFTSKGIQVWLRYAHEMNYYVTDGSEGAHYTGSVADFQTSWKTMSDAVSSNPNIKMFWSPNSASASDLKQWYPTSGKVDLVGIDIYPSKQQTFAETYGEFCQAFSSADIPFAIGETGAGPDLKQAWLGELVSEGAKQACPNYVGFSWFEYNKEADFRVVTDGETIAEQVLGTTGSSTS